MWAWYGPLFIFDFNAPSCGEVSQRYLSRGFMLTLCIITRVKPVLGEENGCCLHIISVANVQSNNSFILVTTVLQH